MRLLSSLGRLVFARARASWVLAVAVVPTFTPAPDSLDFALRRAAYERATGQTWGVIELLEPTSRGTVRDVRAQFGRASFLLGHAYLEVGGFDEFRRLAATDGGQPRDAFDAWLRTRSTLLEADLGDVAATERLARVHGADRATSALRADSTRAAARERLFTLAGSAMDGSQWEEAYAAYAEAEVSWTAEREHIAGLLDRREFLALWPSWQEGAAPGDALPLDTRPVDAWGDALARAACDLNGSSEAAPPTRAEARLATPAALVPAPSPADWRDVTSLARAAAQRAFERDRALGRLAREDARLSALRRYYAFGGASARAEADRLGERVSRLGALERQLSTIAAGLDSVRAHSTRRLVERAGHTIDRGEAQGVWVGALRHFHVIGPERERPDRLPAGVPSPDSITLAELALAQRVRAFAERMQALAPELIARSDRAAWRPALVDRVRRDLVDAQAQLAHARAIAAAADSAARALATSPERDLAAREAQRLTVEADSLAAGERALRERVAERALRSAVAALDARREAIDYGLAAASYAASVRGAAAESTTCTVVQRAAGTEDGVATGGAAAVTMSADGPEAARWRAQAIARSDSFLVRHPESAARAAVRFQLADVLLVDARQRFRDGMTAFLEAQERGRPVPALPVLERVRPLELYRTILRDDSQFVHRDAVLFNAGSILAESGDASAETFFRDLVSAHGDSPLAAEASLRLGDLHFANERYAEAIEAYERAARGSDADVRLVALYKSGWAQFNRERFLEAADAFRAVLDLYGEGALPAGAVDVRKETEAFLVHTFARAGGAPAFAAYFDRAGSRPYTPRLLMAMGQHYRRFSMFADAARADSLHLERYPLEADALVSAERLAVTHGRAERTDKALDARERFAPRFAPGSAWARAQSSDSVRAAGAAFARGSWTQVAFIYQRRAAAGGVRMDWQRALDHYRTLLTHWPDDPESPAFALNAGEACAALGDDRSALSYYDQAAKTGRDSIPELALRQRLAVTDAAYERGRGTRATGDDALAKDVLAAGDALLERFPAYGQATEVRWREGNLAFAHGWYERAAGDFARLVENDPKSRQVPHAAGLRAEALFRLERYEDAGAAFAVARVAAQQAGNDTLAQRAARALPVCAFRRAEAALKADSSAHATHAKLFAGVADGWPAYEHAPLARYREGLAWRRAGKPTESVAAMTALLTAFPKSEFARDAQLGMAETWREAGDSTNAADAYVQFARRFPKDESAAEAQLTAADLYQGAGQVARADTLRLAYVRAHPEDVATAMAVTEELARRELARDDGAAKPHLADYLKRAAAHPELASKPILAEVRYREAEALRPGYESVRLTLPLKKSIVARRTKLDGLLAAYRKCVDLGVTEWAQASAFRIGEALVAFGTALDDSERPIALQGDDRRAYDEVLAKESQTFYDKGEAVWADLLAHAARPASTHTTEATDAERGAWLVRSEKALWGRLGRRFLFKAETDYPLVSAKGPVKPAPSAGIVSGSGASASLDGAGDAPARAEVRP